MVVEAVVEEGMVVVACWARVWRAASAVAREERNSGMRRALMTGAGTGEGGVPKATIGFAWKRYMARLRRLAPKVAVVESWAQEVVGRKEASASDPVS